MDAVNAIADAGQPRRELQNGVCHHARAECAADNQKSEKRAEPVTGVGGARRDEQADGHIETGHDQQGSGGTARGFHHAMAG